MKLPMRLKPNSTLSAAAALLLLTTACGQNERTVSGQLATDQFALSGAQAVAVDEAGQTYRVPVAADGRFQVTLPVGKTYQVRFANSTRAPGVYDAFAVLVNHDRAGQAHKRFRLTSGEAIDLGRVQRSNTRTLALSAADDDEDDGGDDDDGDTESSGSDDGPDDSDSDSSDDSDSSTPSQDDVDQICDLSSGGDMSSVSGTTSALSANDRDDDGVSDAEDDDDGDSSGSSCDDSDSDDTDSDSDDGSNDDASDDADSDSDSDSSGSSNDCDADDSMDDDCSIPPGEGVSDPIPPVDGNQSGPGGI